jgi:nuclear pore complex protein Nup133
VILYPRFKPSQILRSSYDDILRSRYRPEQWPHILRDLNLESDILQRYVQNGKLEIWFKDLLGLAVTDARGGHIGGQWKHCSETTTAWRRG